MRLIFPTSGKIHKCRRWHITKCLPNLAKVVNVHVSIITEHDKKIDACQCTIVLYHYIVICKFFTIWISIELFIHVSLQVNFLPFQTIKVNIFSTDSFHKRLCLAHVIQKVIIKMNGFHKNDNENSKIISIYYELNVFCKNVNECFTCWMWNNGCIRKTAM